MNNCLDCDSKLFGRIDKKFCSDQCRNAYNNRQNSDSTNYIRNVNAILRKNRKILKKHTPKNISNIKREKLILEGFDFNYFTDNYTTKDNRTYYYCYDYGYLKSTNDWLTLVKKKDGMN